MIYVRLFDVQPSTRCLQVCSDSIESAAVLKIAKTTAQGVPLSVGISGSLVTVVLKLLERSKVRAQRGCSVKSNEGVV